MTAATFADFIRECGYEPPERIEPGRWISFSANGKVNNTAGRCKLFPDGEGGIVYDWRSGECQVWQAKRLSDRSPEAAQRWREKIERDRREAAADREREAETTRKRAGELWDAAKLADDSHPYLHAKGVKCHGLKLYRGPLALRQMRCDNALMLPLRNASGQIVSLQFIAPDGEKRYLAGPMPHGAYFSIGKPAGTICIAEGYATAATIHEATGYAVAIAFDAGKVEDIAKAMRAKFPEARLVLCADDDWRTTNPKTGELSNTGILAATSAALAVGGVVAIPTFGPDRTEETDFNDSARMLGADAVRKAIEAAQPPNVSQHQPEPKRAPEATTQAPEGGFGGFVGAASGDLSGEWPEPQALPEGLPAVKEFDPALLPEALRPWIVDIGERLQCPLDFVAVGAMVGLGSVIGRKVSIRPQRETDWTEFPNLWGCIIGRPSVMKSPALEQALGPLRRLEARASKDYERAILEFEAQQRLSKLRRENAEAEMKKRLKTNLHADCGDLMIQDPEEPQRKRYIANDATYEALGELLHHNPNGILAFRDELVSLLKTLDRDDNAPARGFYLTGWNGNSAYTFDRMTRAGASLDAVCLSVLGSTQPGRIAEYVRNAVKGGSGDDGLMQRFGLLIWPDHSPEWRDVDRTPDSEASRKAWEIFDRLDRIEEIGERDIDRHTGEPKGQPFLRFDDAALDIFRDWREAWEKRFRAGAEIPALESHFNKYRKLIPALALICHLADECGGPVSAVSVLRALSWAEYLEPHARRAYASLTAPENAAAKAIIDRIRKGDLPTEFRARDVYAKNWAHLGERQTVHDALTLLADFDWLGSRDRPTAGTGGRPTTIYVANPRGFRA